MIVTYTFDIFLWNYMLVSVGTLFIMLHSQLVRWLALITFLIIKQINLPTLLSDLNPLFS